VSARCYGILLFVIFVALLSERALLAQESPPPGSHWEYHLGRGLRLGDTGVTVGGYGSLQFQDLHHQPWELSASALSLFVSWDGGGRVHLFSELELEDFAVIREGREFGSRSDPFEVERLYADFLISDAATIRLGKFLTPIGRWNLIHAAPLVWTTSRPQVTFRPFSSDVTGAMLYGTISSLGNDLDYSLYVEATDELSPDRRERPFTEAVGFHLVYHLPENAELGFSYANFEQEERREERDNLFGLNFLWVYQRVELSSEFVYRVGEEGPDKDEWGVFVQGVVSLSARWFAIGRYEFFQPQGSSVGAHLWVGGLAFRPLPPLVLKAEYSVGLHARDDMAPGFATSLAILF
jgi:hypothetical protein